MTILRLVGPVISTRRSWSASGTGATGKSSGAVTKSSDLAGVEPLLELLAGIEQLAAARVKLLVEPARPAPARRRQRSS